VVHVQRPGVLFVSITIHFWGIHSDFHGGIQLVDAPHGPHSNLQMRTTDALMADITNETTAQAATLMAAARAVYARQEVIMAADAVVVHGPGGAWTIMMYHHRGRGVLALKVRGPVERPFNSIASLRNFLVSRYGLVDVPLDDGNASAQPSTHSSEDEDDEATAPPPPPPSTHETLAAVRIQTVWRAKSLWAHLRERVDIRRRMEQLQVEWALSTSLTATVLTSIAAGDAQSQICRRALDVRDKFAPLDNPFETLDNLLTNHTFVDRQQILEQARTILDPAARSLVCVQKLAHATLHERALPMILGSLDLPPCDAFAWLDTTWHVVVTDELSKVHEELLVQRFDRKWADDCRTLFTGIPHVRALDLYADAAHTVHLGSMIICRNLMRVRESTHPVIQPISIAARKDAPRGVGTCLFDMCTRLLFSDVHTNDIGYVVAQCVKIDFWEYRLQPETRAQCIVMQMMHLYPDFYHVCTNCVCRGREFHRSDVFGSE